MKKFLVLLAVVFCFAGCTKEETNFASKWEGRGYQYTATTFFDLGWANLIFTEDGFASCKFTYSIPFMGSGPKSMNYAFKKKGNTIKFSTAFAEHSFCIFDDYATLSDDGLTLTIKSKSLDENTYVWTFSRVIE